MSKFKIVIALVASFFLFLVANDAHATHFRYGNITYTVPDPVNAPTTVRFDVTVAWRQAFVDTVTFVFGDGQQVAIFLLPSIEFRETHGRMVFRHFAVDAGRLAVAADAGRNHEAVLGASQQPAEGGRRGDPAA